MVKIKSEAVDPPFERAIEVGKNYVGLSDIGTFTPGKTLRYGFIFLRNPKLTINFGTQVILDLAPQSITIDEPAATNIVPTQNSGKFIERRGQIIKNITISGTTGFNPRPVLPNIARSALGPADTVAIEGPSSGLGKFVELRSLFRLYWESFSSPDAVREVDRENAAFVFINEKDDEAWVVEPMNFRMIRQAPRNKFTYNYEITLQTIALVEDIFLLEEPLTLLDKVANFRSVVSNIANRVSELVNVIGDIIATVVGAVRAAMQAISTVLTNISDGLNSIADGATSFLGLGNEIKGNIGVVKNSFMDTWDNLQAVGEEVQFETGVDPITPIIVATMVEAATLIARLSGRAELFNESLPDTWSEDVVDLYDPSYGFGGTNDLISQPLSLDGVREGEIIPGDDLLTIASKELGNAERFHEIAILNNLKPPYISPSIETRLPNTLAPGDPILIPAVGVPDSSKAPVRTTVFTDPTFIGEVITGGAIQSTIDTEGAGFRDDQWAGFTVEITVGTGAGQERKIVDNGEETFDVDKAWSVVPNSTSVVKFFLRRLGRKPEKSANEQLLGTDMRLTRQKDLAKSSSGDIDLIEGTPNVVQAIDTKFKTRPGEMAANLAFGLGFEPGSKLTADDLISYKVAARQVLISDNRIESVRQLKVTGQGDISRVEGFAILASGAQPFAVDTRGVS